VRATIPVETRRCTNENYLSNRGGLCPSGRCFCVPRWRHRRSDGAGEDQGRRAGGRRTHAGRVRGRRVPGRNQHSLDQVEKRLADFGDHKRAIVVYCRSGHRSGQAKAILDKNGFTDVTDGGAFKDMPPR